MASLVSRDLGGESGRKETVWAETGVPASTLIASHVGSVSQRTRLSFAPRRTSAQMTRTWNLVVPAPKKRPIAKCNATGPTTDVTSSLRSVHRITAGYSDSQRRQSPDQ